MNKSKSVAAYTMPRKSDHQYDEEQQWLRIVQDTNHAKAMLLIFIQKLCAAFHELGPAYEVGALKHADLDYSKQRLYARAQAVIERLKLNGFEGIDGTDELSTMMARLEAATAPTEIIEMSEKIHLINHKLCDAIEMF